MHLVRKEDFGKFSMTPTQKSSLTDEALGFFSMVVSYAKAADKLTPENGLKHEIPIMPRTDFATMYKTFIKDDLTKTGISPCTSLVNIVNELARSKAMGMSFCFLSLSRTYAKNLAYRSAGADATYSKKDISKNIFTWKMGQRQQL